MPKNRKSFLLSSLIVVFSILIIGVLYKGLQIDQTTVPSVLLDTPASNIKADWLQGSQFVPDSNPNFFELNNTKGKVVIVNFWASWCYACRAEAKELERFWNEVVKGNPELILIGVATQDEADRAMQFATQFGKTYPLVLDQNGNAGIEYGITGVPETFFINKNGIISDKIAGEVNYEFLVSMSEKLLKDTSVKH